METLDVAIEAMLFLAMRQGSAVLTDAPTPEHLQEAQRMLGCPLPPSFVAFMQRAGDKLPKAWDVYWVGGPEMARRNIVIANDLERAHETSPLPEFLVTFFEDTNGDQYCFDLRPPCQEQARDGAAKLETGFAGEAAGDPLSLLEPVDEDAVRQEAVRALFSNDRFGRNQDVKVAAGDQREYPVVIWDRAQGVEQLDESLCIVADNFVDWLKEFTYQQM